MTWLRLDDSFPSHPKVAPLSDAAFRLHVTAKAYCCQFGTDGFIAEDALATLPAVARGAALKRAITELAKVRHGQRHPLWEPVESGWRVHDFLDYNLSAADGRALSEARRAAGKRGGQRSGESRRSKPEALASLPEQQLVRDGFDQTEANANPSRPVPVPVTQEPPVSSESIAIGAAAPEDRRPVVNGALTPAFVDRVRRTFPGLAENNFRGAVLSLVWKDLLIGAPPVAKLEPLDGIREVPTWKLAVGLQKYLQAKLAAGEERYGIADFVAHLKHWIPAERKPQTPVAVAIPDTKPERTDGERARVAELADPRNWPKKARA